MRVGKLQFFFVRWENKNTKVSAVVSGYGLSEVSRLMFARWSVRIADNGGGMKSCRLRAIHYQVTRKLKRATTLE
jgi:hypothetical protein